MPLRVLSPRIGLATLSAAVALAAPCTAGASGAYEVAWGDTLSGIALRLGTTVEALARANGIADPNLVLAGTTLAVAGADAGAGTQGYRVRWGDTLSAIAARHGVSLAELARLNGLDPRRVLLAGTVLRVPRSGASAAPSGWSVEGSLATWADHYGVDRGLVRALAWMESGYQTDVVSPAGARGVMQVTPAAWSFVGDVLLGESLARTADNDVRVGVAYLDHMLHVFAGDERLALAAYYQGTTSVRLHGLFPETRAYVADVLALRSRGEP